MVDTRKLLNCTLKNDDIIMHSKNKMACNDFWASGIFIGLEELKMRMIRQFAMLKDVALQLGQKGHACSCAGQQRVNIRRITRYIGNFSVNSMQKFDSTKTVPEVSRVIC